MTVYPDFYVIGAPKAGTTSLHHYLSQHPELSLPVTRKEPGYLHFLSGEPSFSTGPTQCREYAADAYRRKHRISTTSPEEYEAVWSDDSDLLRGEVTPSYLQDPEVSAVLARLRPDAKLIVILREPLERAYSDFLMNRRLGTEPIEDFSEAVAAEESCPRYFWGARSYLYASAYATHLTRWLRMFDPAQFSFNLFEDLAGQSETLLDRLFDFLGVSQFRIEPGRARNPNLDLKSSPLVRLYTSQSPLKEPLRRVIPSGLRDRVWKRIQERAPEIIAPPLDPEVKIRLRERFRPGVLELETILGRKLDAWITSE